MYRFALVIGLLSGACVVEEQEQEQESETASALSDPELGSSVLSFTKKPFLQTWKNFCESLNGHTTTFYVAGCTTTTTYENCTIGGVSGSCHCDYRTDRVGPGCN